MAGRAANERMVAALTHSSRCRTACNRCALAAGQRLAPTHATDIGVPFPHRPGLLCRHAVLSVGRLYTEQLARWRGRLFAGRSEEHTSELQSLMRNSYDVFCLK